MGGEYHPNKLLNTTRTAITGCRHPFTDFVMEAPLLDKWKGFNKDHYDGTTDLNEHTDAYTINMYIPGQLCCHPTKDASYYVHRRRLQGC